MGHRNSAQSLCRMLSKVLKGLLWRNLFSYLDDLLLVSQTADEHLELLETVLQRFRQHRLKLNAEKSEFAVKEIPFLGYKISEKGLSLDPTKLHALENYKKPTNKKELKQYLGFANFLKRAVKSFTLIAGPLYKLLRKNATFEWTDECERAFRGLNEAIKSADTIQLPDYSKPFIIETDSSINGTGSCLLQKGDNGKVHPIHFASFRFSQREQKQSITFQELLGCVMALKYFHKYIAYSKVILKTDHRPIVYLFKNAYTDSQISRMLTVFERYDLDIQFTPGRSNVVADYLSRAQTVAFKELSLEKLEHYADDMSFPMPTSEKHEQKSGQLTRLHLPKVLESEGLKSKFWQQDPVNTQITETEDAEFYHHNKNIPQSKPTTKQKQTNETDSQIHETEHTQSENPVEATSQIDKQFDNSWETEVSPTQAMLIKDQQKDTYFAPIYEYLDTGKLPNNDQKARFVAIESEFYEIKNGILYRLSLTQYAKNNSRLQYCVALPKQYVQTVLELHHKSGHYSNLKMFHHLRDKYYFPKMRKSIETYVTQCPECQQYKNPRQADRQYITPTNLPRMLERWSIDLKGPITSGSNFRYILVAIEHVSRYMELCPLIDCTTNTIMKAFYDNIILRFGKPSSIELDRASYFTSDTMKAVAKLLGCDLKYAYSYIHHSNGRCETMIRTVSSQLGKLCTENPSTWHTLLPSIAHAHNTYQNLATNFSPYFLMFGREYVDHFEATFQTQNQLSVPQSLQEVIVQIVKARDTALAMLKDTHEVYSKQITDRYTKKSKPVKFELLQPVYVKAFSYTQGTSKALTKRWLGPFYIREILQSHGAKLSQTVTGEILKTEFHLDLLKPAYARHVETDTQAISLENLDPQDVPRFRLEIADRPPSATNVKTDQHSSPLQSLTEVNEAQNKATENNTPEKTEHTAADNDSEVDNEQTQLLLKPVAKKYMNGSIWLLFPETTTYPAIWKHIKQCTLDRKFISTLPWYTRRGRLSGKKDT